MVKAFIAPATLANVEASFKRILLDAGFQLVYPKRVAQLTEAELIEELGEAWAALAGSEPYTRRVFEAHPQLRVVARVGVGYDAVDVAAATEHNVAVTITPGSNQDAVAEHTFALMLALAKSVCVQHNAMSAGVWNRFTTLPLRGRTLGIAGLGRIGKAVAVRARVFGMKVLAYEPFPDQAFVAKEGITLTSFERLLTESDYLTLHIPLTPESRHLINKQTLAQMKPTAFLINTSRGLLVNEADLAEALRERRIAGAGLDVFEHEPPGQNPLLSLDNVVLTPHAAGVDLQSRDDMAAQAARAVVTLYRGDWPATEVVNPDVRQGVS